MQLTGVASRKVHGGAGAFDVDLANGNGIECRSGAAHGDHTLVFTFSNPVTNVEGVSVTSGKGSVGSAAIGSDPHQYVVDLTGLGEPVWATILGAILPGIRQVPPVITFIGGAIILTGVFVAAAGRQPELSMRRGSASGNFH